MVGLVVDARRRRRRHAHEPFSLVQEFGRRAPLAVAVVVARGRADDKKRRALLFGSLACSITRSFDVLAVHTPRSTTYTHARRRRAVASV